MNTTFIKNTKYEILTPSGFSNFDGIKTKYTEAIYHLKFEDGKELRCTPCHLIKVGNSFISAENLEIGQIGLIYKRIIDEKTLVFDAVNVEKNNEYITNGIVSHNCSFVGSSYTLISPLAISLMNIEDPIAEDEHMKTYKMPERDRAYFMACDPAEGKERDYSAFTVFDITEYPFTIVATYRNNEISPNLWPDIINRVAKAYNYAAVLIENNNSPQVPYILSQELEYENLISESYHGTEFGIKTTKTTKRIGCSNFKDLVETQKLLINDLELKREINTFVKNNKGSYSAEDGKHDDLVMTCVHASWFFTTDQFKDIHDKAVRQMLREHQNEAIEQSLAPFGFIDDGLNHQEQAYLDNEQQELLLSMRQRNREVARKVIDDDHLKLLGYDVPNFERN